MAAVTCPADDLPEFYREHWDVYELCSLMRCPVCTAEDGEGVFFELAEPCEYGGGDDLRHDGMPF